MPGSISKLMGVVGQGGSLSHAIGAAAPLLDQQTAKTLGGGAKSAAASLQSMNRPHPRGGFGGGSGLGGIKPTDTHKAAYMAVLTAALHKAHQSHFFNLETAINDLNVKLGNLRGSQAHLDSLGETIGQSSLLSSELQTMMSKMGTVISEAARHLK